MKILITGDFCPTNKVKSLFDNDQFDLLFGQVRHLISKSDYAITNFECPITYGTEAPIQKYGPNLCCSPKGMEAVNWAGFHCVTLANNHFKDFGEKGCLNTLENCKQIGLDYVGGGKDLHEASQTLFKRIGNEVLAIINCCEHEFSIATSNSAGSNPLEPIQQYYAIRDAKSKADYVIIIVHGGHEMWQLPSIRMQDTYRFFVDVGADAVINHHQHCYSGYELYHNKPIFYGLGNFCFASITGKRSILWHEGYLLQLYLEKDKIDYAIYPYKQCESEPIVEILPKGAFDKKLKKLNRIISDRNELLRQNTVYYQKSLKNVISAFEPIQNRYLNALQRRGWLPSLLGKKQLYKMHNNICCESHLDKMVFFLQSSIKRYQKKQ